MKDEKHRLAPTAVRLDAKLFRSSRHYSKRLMSGKSFLAFIALVFAVAAGSANPRDAWLQDGKPVTDQPNAAISKNFGVLQIATNDPERLNADWRKPARGVHVNGSTQASRNRPTMTFIVFKGCRVDKSGNCNVTADFDVYNPAGELSSQSKAAAIWVGKLPAPGANLQLSTSGLGLSFDEKDASGAYRVHATVTDHVAEVTLQTEQVLTVQA